MKICSVLARLIGVMPGVSLMAVRHMGVLMRLIVFPGGMVLGRGPVMLRGMLVMVSCFVVVLFAFFRHGCSLSEINGSRLEDTLAL
jgi:hypothetical protein